MWPGSRSEFVLLARSSNAELNDVGELKGARGENIIFISLHFFFDCTKVNSTTKRGGAILKLAAGPS